MKASKIGISQGYINEAIDIMREAAQWLIQTKKPLWHLEDLNKEKLLKDNNEKEFYVGWIGKNDVSAMILKWYDPFFWPNIKENESGFIHKLSIRRNYAGMGISKMMVEFAVDECKKRGINVLRLDCAGDREKLCRIYEKMGFIQVGRRMIGKFDIAFYELRF
jgi:GNAT superfamily N-acetyltransferase